MKRSLLLPFIPIALFTLLLTSCSIVPIPRIHRAKKVGPGYTEVGYASWYGPKFHGRRTSSGEIFNMYDMTCAHRTLPLGTILLVTNLENGRSVVVRVNDRGPFVKGRIIDLSYAAARALGMVEKGVVKVRIRVLGFSKNYRSRSYWVQAAAFLDRIKAIRLARRLRKHGAKVIAERTRGVMLYKVRFGPFRTRKEAEKKARELAENGIFSFVVSPRM